MTTTINDLYTELRPISTGAMAKFVWSPGLEKKFTCVSRFEETYITFRTDYKHIWVPRAVAPIGEKDLRIEGTKCGFKSKVVPRNDEQVRILSEAKPLLDAGESFQIRAATGTGKTILALDLIAHVNRPTLVIVPKDDLMQQWYAEAKKVLSIPENRIGMIQGDICSYQNKWLVFAMIHSISKDSRYPADMYKHFGMIVFDECFVAGTKIGIKNIEDVEVGDIVESYDEVTGGVVTRRVNKLYRKTPTSMRSLRLTSGELVTCTDNHPFFVDGKWVVAKDIRIGDTMVCIDKEQNNADEIACDIKVHYLQEEVRLESAIYPKPRQKQGRVQETVLQRYLRPSFLAEDVQDKRGTTSRVQSEVLQCPYEGQQPYVKTGSCSEAKGYSSGYGVEAHRAGWKRAWTNCTSEVAGFFARLADGVRFSYEAEAGVGIPRTLQTRYSKSNSQDIYRSGRGKPLQPIFKEERPEEDHILREAKVESITVHEQTGDGTFGGVCPEGFVYNFEVDGTHTYFANGILAHNCHRLAAETFSDSGCVFPAKIRLGLSATPERSDGKESLIEAHIGPVKIIADGDPLKFKVLRYKSNWECPRVPVREGGKTRYVRIKHSAGKCGHITNMIAGFRQDHEVVAGWVKKAYAKDRYTVVFSDRIAHLQKLMDACRHAGVPGKDMGLYVAATEVDGKKKTMTRAQKEVSSGKRVIFASWGAMKEGTNLPWLDTCIFATPRSDVKQAVGRILREYEGKKFPTVFDLVHNDSGVFRGYADKRLSYYADKKAVVKDLN